MIGINEITKSIGTAVVALLIGLGAAEAQSSPSSAVVKDIAPSGTLRAAINAGNVVLVQKNARGELQGVTVDLARELAKRLAVPAALVEFAAAGKVTDAVKTGSWDVGFVAIEPKRAEVIDFTAPYVIIEGTYVAADNSPLRSIADVDREGIHIAVARGSAYDLYLSRTLQHATLLRYPTPPLALEGYVIDKIDVAAGVRQQLDAFAKSHPGYRVMDGHFQEIREAMGVPLGHAAGLQYLKTFVEEMKASGFVRKALDRSGQTDAIVAPAAAD